MKGVRLVVNRPGLCSGQSPLSLQRVVAPQGPVDSSASQDIGLDGGAGGGAPPSVTHRHSNSMLCLLLPSGFLIGLFGVCYHLWRHKAKEESNSRFICITSDL